MILLLVVAVTLASFLLTWALRCYARSRRIIDIPDRHSSHSTPTPSGGGMAIVLTFMVGLAVLKAANYLPDFLFWTLLGAGSWVGLIGWIDDLWYISAKKRLIAHFIGAAWVLFWMEGLPPLLFFGYLLDLGWIGQGLAAVYLVWVLNLFNFMDGIDGIAGIEAITVCLGGLILWLLSPAGEAMWLIPLLLAAAVTGFLFWNFPKSRIFMGDGGSCFLGLVLGVLSIHAGWIAPELFWGWAILLGAFVVDATFTLMQRIMRGENIYHKHCSHAYQHAARIYDAHWPVALAYGVINLFWLLPVAILVVTGLMEGILGVGIAYGPLILAAYWFGAGRPEKKENFEDQGDITTAKR